MIANESATLFISNLGPCISNMLVTESFFSRHLNELAESIVDVSPYLRISAAQGLEIPYVGHIELPIAFLGHTFSAIGFPIVRHRFDDEKESSSLHRLHLSQKSPCLLQQMSFTCHVCSEWSRTSEDLFRTCPFE